MQKMDLRLKRCPNNYSNFKDGAAISNRCIYLTSLRFPYNLNKQLSQKKNIYRKLRKLFISRKNNDIRLKAKWEGMCLLMVYLDNFSLSTICWEFSSNFLFSLKHVCKKNDIAFQSRYLFIFGWGI